MDECGIEIQKRKECETMEIGDLPTIHEIQDETEFVCRLKCIVEVHHKWAVHLKTRQPNPIIPLKERLNSKTVQEFLFLLLPASRFHCLLVFQSRKPGTRLHETCLRPVKWCCYVL